VGERARLHQHLYESLRDELAPDGSAEEAAVLDYAILTWKRRRLNIGSQLAYRGHPDAAALAKAGKDGWDGVAKYLTIRLATGTGCVMRCAPYQP
jgi:hypothetical protein